MNITFPKVGHSRVTDGSEDALVLVAQRLHYKLRDDALAPELPDGIELVVAVFAGTAEECDGYERDERLGRALVAVIRDQPGA